MKLRIHFSLFQVATVYIYFQFTRVPPICK